MKPLSTPAEPLSSNTAPLSGAAEEHAQRFRRAFLAQLARESAALESPATEELLAAVDGELDPAAIELWQERLALEPHLASRVADLERFRSEIDEAAAGSSRRPARLLPFRRPEGRSLAVWAAAAAVLLLALGIQFGPRLSPFSERSRAAVPVRLDWAPEPLFTDGFEAGDASNWSGVTPSG